MKLFFNAHLYQQEGDSFVVDEDHFVEFGKYEILRTKYPNTEAIDLAGKYVYPGFNDSHMHLLNYGLFLSNVSLYEHTSSIVELQNYLKEQIKEVKPNSFVRCRGYNQDYFVEKRMLTRTDLDEVSKEVALIVVRACGHILVLNSKAIELLKFQADEKVEMGCFDLETGIFEEFACNAVFERLPEPSVEDLKNYIVKGARALNSYGITSCQSDDFQVFPHLSYEKAIKAYDELIAENKLSVRVCEQNELPKLEALKEFIQKGYHQKQNKFYRSGPLKLIGDGSLGARTACLSKDYYDEKGNRGIGLYSQAELDEIVAYADAHGMAVATHCIGDGFLDLLLNSYKKVLKDGSNPLGHGIVHVQVTRNDQIADIIKYHINCFVQTIFIDYDAKIVEERLGKDLAATSYQFKTLSDAGLIVSNGSDCPVEMPDVLRGIECGVTRCPIGSSTPYLAEQAYSIEQIIDSYTIQGAKQTKEEKLKGKLAENYLADFVVLDAALSLVPKNKIHEVKVLGTYLGGQKVY